MMRSIVLLLVATFLLISCKQNPVKEHKTLPDGKGYFSIKLYMKDYEENHIGQPYMLMKYVEVNGKKDTAVVNEKEMNWETLKSEFGITDIGYQEFIDQYKFTRFNDPDAQTNNFIYEAKNPDLKTTKLHICTDMLNDRILYIFIHHVDKQFFKTISKQFYFSPLKTISINTQHRYLIGPDKKERIEYKYLTD